MRGFSDGVSGVVFGVCFICSIKIDLVRFHVDEFVQHEQREEPRDEDSAEDHRPDDDGDFLNFGQGGKLRDGLVEPEHGQTEEHRGGDSGEDSLGDAAPEEGAHDEPPGGPYELHRVDEVSFREDRQADGVAQQDERHEEQGPAEEQEHEADFQALYLLKRAGVEPRKLLETLALLPEGTQYRDVLSKTRELVDNHPSVPKRIEYLKSQMEGFEEDFKERYQVKERPVEQRSSFTKVLLSFAGLC